MNIWIKNIRKDGKYTVTLGFDTGRRINKIMTREEVLKHQEQARPITPHKTPFDLMRENKF